VLYERRGYDIVPELLDEYLTWANDIGLPFIVEKFEFRVIGFWHAVAPAGGAVPATNVHWIVAWNDEKEMLDRWEALGASPEWQAILQRRFYLKTERKLLRAIPRSPLK
jgi:hypothetical protein